MYSMTSTNAQSVFVFNTCFCDLNKLSMSFKRIDPIVLAED